MQKYSLTNEAESDIINIFDYISADNKISAKKVVRSIKSTFDMISDMPHIGRVVHNIDVSFARIVPVRKFHNYVIVYIIIDEAVLIVRVLNARRDIPTILDSSLLNLIQ